MMVQEAALDINKQFAGLVAGIEELEGLEAPGWGFLEGLGIGLALAGLFVAGLT